MDEGSQHVEANSVAGVATAECGEVMLDGPNGVAVSMTPNAAEQTARSLLAAAEAAKQQDPEI